MRLFPVTFLASDSNARASIESYEWPSRRREYTVVDLLTSCRRRQRRAAVVLRPCDRYVTDWHTTQPTPTEKCPMYAPLDAHSSHRITNSRLVSRSKRRQGPSVSRLDCDFAEKYSLSTHIRRIFFCLLCELRYLRYPRNTSSRETWCDCDHESDGEMCEIKHNVWN